MSHFPESVLFQLERTVGLIRQYFPQSLVGIYLFGSALHGGLRPESDLDLLVCVKTPLDPAVRGDLMRDLLEISAPPGTHPWLRALEVTIVLESDVRPWRYPSRRQFQFGEWLREEIMAGRYGRSEIDVDLAILFWKLHLGNRVLYGPEAKSLFDPIPLHDLTDALTATLKLWNRPDDWHGDERNVILTLARIWFTLSTGAIASKDEAADWLLKRLPREDASVLRDARDAYLGRRRDDFQTRGDEVERLVRFVKQAISASTQK